MENDYVEPTMKAASEALRDKEVEERAGRRATMFACCKLSDATPSKHGFRFPITDK